MSANDVDPLAIAAIELNAGVNGVTVTPVLGDLLDSTAIQRSQVST